MEFITQSAVKIYYEFLHLRSFICLGMQKNMDIAELNNKIGYILSFPSAVSQRIKTKVAKECTMLSKHGALYPRAVGMPTSSTGKDIGAKNPRAATVLGFFRAIFKVEFKRYHSPKSTFGEDLNYRPRLSGADFAEFFAKSAPFFVSGFVKCLCLGGCA